MIGEVISIGDELTTGQRLDTNSQWVSQRLGELGVTVRYHTTVADDLKANVDVFSRAAARADLIVATGGLGPTADDLTREALAAVAGVELVLDEASLEHIRGLFARFKRDMPDSNRLQAMFPRGSRPIFNSQGTAPGIWQQLARMDLKPTHIFALPGVPAEMKEMFANSVAPAVAAMFSRPRVIVHRRIKCFGVGESHLEQMLPDLIRRGRDPSVGITVHAATITLRITAAAETADAARAAIEPTEKIIRDCLGTLVFGDEDDELEHAVLKSLIVRGATLATVEWGAQAVLASSLADAGQTLIADNALQARVTQGPYQAGLVLGSLSAAAELLANSAPMAAGASAYERLNEAVVGSLAAAARVRYQSDYALAVGPFPSAEGRADPLPYFFALATADKIIVRSGTLASHASIWRARAAKQALNLLRLALLER